MTTVGQIEEYLNSRFPVERKESWDHVGLNCGRRNAPVTKVLVALDPFRESCREALDAGADLLVTHHALLWEPGFITDDSAQGENALFLMSHNIAHFNAHTNLDVAPDGVNQVLARVLELDEIAVISDCGASWGLLRKGTVPEQPLEAFLAHVKAALGCPGLRYVSGGKPVRRVAVGGGACADEMAQAQRAGCDTFVTADVKYNQFWDAEHLGLNLIDAGHYYTEVPVCRLLADTIREGFPGLPVQISKNQRDCMKFF